MNLFDYSKMSDLELRSSLRDADHLLSSLLKDILILVKTPETLESVVISEKRGDFLLVSSVNTRASLLREPLLGTMGELLKI